MKYNKMLVFLFLVWLPFFTESIAAVNYDDALWAKSTVAGSGDSIFYSVATDSNGNSYGAGYMEGNNAHDFGNGVTVSGAGYTENILLVKYDANGNAVWAKSTTSASERSSLRGMTVDGDGNIYVVGYIEGSDPYSLGNGVTVSGTASNPNVLIAKYDASGNALWAKSTSAGSSVSMFYGIAVDTSGNAYAVGNIYGNSAYGFGDGITATGSANAYNIILIKYDTSGTAKWAKTVSGSTGASSLNTVVLDNAGNPYVAGAIKGTSTFNFGNSVTVTGINAYDNIILVKYDSNGNAEWAKTAIASTNDSFIKALALDDGGNIFGGGYVNGGGFYGFGDDVNATAIYAGENSLILKYNSTGNTQWAKFPIVAPNKSQFSGATVDGDGSIYVGGFIKGNAQFNFGNNVTVSGVVSLDNNILLVSYDTNGNTLQAKSVVNGTSWTTFNSVHMDSIGDLYAGGDLYGTESYDFGNNVTVNGSSGSLNIVIAKYKGNYTESSSSHPSSSSSSNKQPAASSSSSSNPAVVSEASSITNKLPKLFAVGGAILLLF